MRGRRQPPGRLRGGHRLQQGGRYDAPSPSPPLLPVSLFRLKCPSTPLWQRHWHWPEGWGPYKAAEQHPCCQTSSAPLQQRSRRWRGVEQLPRQQLWAAAVNVCGRQRLVGVFRNNEDAARAVDLAALQLCPEEVTPGALNFPVAGEDRLLLMVFLCACIFWEPRCLLFRPLCPSPSLSSPFSFSLSPLSAPQ